MYPPPPPPLSLHPWAVYKVLQQPLGNAAFFASKRSHKHETYDLGKVNAKGRQLFLQSEIKKQIG
jgi:hypothetical protein